MPGLDPASIDLRNTFQSKCFSKKDGSPGHPGRGLTSGLLRAVFAIRFQVRDEPDRSYPVAKTSYDVTQRLHFGFGGFWPRDAFRGQLLIAGQFTAKT
jgi:hypothetical protein